MPQPDGFKTCPRNMGNLSEKREIQEILKKEVHSHQGGLSTSMEM